MNNLYFSRKNNNVGENAFSGQQTLNDFGSSNNNFSNLQTQSANTAQNYYPETLNLPDNSTPKSEQAFDINDLSQFQQDFSYLQNSTNQENFTKNEEKSQKKAENIENFAENSNFSNKKNKNSDFQDKNPDFSPNYDIFSALNNEEKNQKQKNNQKNGINIEKIMNFLKNGSQNDLISSVLASGVFKNQNPVMVETLSKMLTQRNPTKSQKHEHTSDSDSFEEM